MGNPGISLCKPTSTTTAGLTSPGAARFDLNVSAGPLSHEKIMTSIELCGTKVAPLVRDMLFS